MTRRILIAVIAVLLAAPVQAQLGGGGPARPPERVPFPPIVDFHSVTITLSRGPCFGSCPVYRVEIDGDGSVRYQGDRFVGVTGARTAHVRISKVRSLVRAFQKADFFWTFDSYRAPITDLPTYTLAIAFDGRSKQVVDYDGAMRGMPKEIAALEAAIDATAGTDRWVKEGQ
jgi:hypothetical protein